MVQSHRHKDTCMFLPICSNNFQSNFSFSPLTDSIVPSTSFCTFSSFSPAPLPSPHPMSYSFLSSATSRYSYLSLFYLSNLYLPTCTCTHAAFCPTSSLHFTLSTDDSVHVHTWTGQNAVTMMDEICMLAHVISR